MIARLCFTSRRYLTTTSLSLARTTVNMKKPTTMILKNLRKLMKDTSYVPEPLQAYIVPSSDAHNSEYLASRDERRAFISGFTGSAGTAVVTDKAACLWTDGRYHIQAAEEMDDNWTLMKEGVAETPSRGDWLAQNLNVNATVGADPFLMTQSSWKALKQKLDMASIRLIPVQNNLVDAVWSDQPDYPENLVVPLELKFCGKTWEEKVAKCRERMKEKRVSCLVLSALDDVAWLLNLRGSDIKYNPVFFAYAAITEEKVFLFISENQVTEAVRQHLRSGNEEVEIHPYQKIQQFIERQNRDTPGRMWLSNDASQGLLDLTNERNCVLEVSPVTLMKAVKNQTEMEGFINCHIRDAAALCCYFSWLEREVPKGTVTEISGADMLEKFRSEQDHFVGLSFTTISSVGPNAAIIHYHPSEETNRTLTSEEVYLCDSGGQYKDGTTDVTRTLHFGSPSDHEKECFTRVLKGNIQLARAIFPSRIRGNCLDSFARQALWSVGLDYMHGTGHGVGSYLNVHEGPMGISWRPYPDDPGLMEGMILSDEPGYYEAGKFGIRIETLVRVVKADTKHNFNNRGFLTFEPVTVVPIQRKMINPAMLTSEEMDYLNQYHETCREQVGQLLREQGKKEALNWLIKETEPIG